MVTAGTYQKTHYFHSKGHLSLLQDALFSLAQEYGWNLQAWAVFPNHYHFIAISPKDSSNLKTFIRHLHSVTAREINRIDETSNRKIWFQYWDTQLTFEKSYFARLNYVHQNPVRHKVAVIATDYEWCSARWFEQNTTPSFVRTIGSFKIDRLKVDDDFEVEWMSENEEKAVASHRTPK